MAEIVSSLFALIFWIDTDEIDRLYINCGKYIRIR